MHLQAFELLVLNALDWDLNAVTPVLWRDLILEFIEKHVDQASLYVKPLQRSEDHKKGLSLIIVI